ncbi:MAG: phosphopantetheine-binding protein [Prevotellaceae bacterium]|jgi:acyl carrier protein|nr:phosphopantetheine-binding protein [Prevotellaceae bacterium]
METQQLIKEVNEALATEFEIEVSSISAGANIKDTLDLDSLGLVDMVALIENKFGVKIQSADIPAIKIFEDLYNFLLGKLK